MIYLIGDINLKLDEPVFLKTIENVLKNNHNLDRSQYYLLQDGKKVISDDLLNGSPIRICLRVHGGKGGFGSMLRAIGAQIEKTTNREACRDLSGRRLRDINEEKRLKNWIASQSDRDREASEKKQKKLERLCAEPNHKFQDSKYEKIRSELPDKVSSAVEQGFRASSQVGTKRKQETKTQDKKKRKLWIDADLDDLDNSDSEEGENEETISKTSTSTDDTNVNTTPEKDVAVSDDQTKDTESETETKETKSEDQNIETGSEDEKKQNTND